MTDNNLYPGRPGSTGIFSQTAPAYYARGLSVIPLHRMDKRPVTRDWSRFADETPSLEEQKDWLDRFGDGNIGLVLGKQSGVSVLDIDTDDEHLISLLLGCIGDKEGDARGDARGGAKRWVRIGKKGMVIGFRYSGLRTFRIRTAEGKSICEFLSDKTQVVLPPSIHPETRKPYTANVELLEVIDSLPVAPDDLEERIRKVLEKAGVILASTGWSRVTEHIAPGMRDINLTEKAGLFAYAVMRGERTLIEAIGMLRSFNEQFVQRLAGDEVDMEKHIANLVRFIHRDVQVKKRPLPIGWDTGMTPEDKKKLGVDFGRDAEEWPMADLMTHLDEAVEGDFQDAVASGRVGLKGDLGSKERKSSEEAGRKSAQGGAKTIKAIQTVLEKMSRSGSMSPIEVDMVLSKISKLNCGITQVSLRKMLVAMKKDDGGIEGGNHTEVAQAVIEDIEAIHPVRHAADRLWKYNGAYWEVLDDGWVVSFISRNYGDKSSVKKNSDIRGVLNLLKVLVGQGLRSGEEFDADLVNFANGVLLHDRMGGMRLVPHSPDYGLTYILPFRYIDHGRLLEGARKVGDWDEFHALRQLAPRFAEFLEDCFGPDADFREKVRLVQEMFAVTLFGRGFAFQRAFLLHGVPKSGKSQMITILSSLVPQEARSAVNPADWHDKYMPAGMFRKLLNVAGELSEKRKLDGQKFKDVVDGSEITGQHKFGQPFTFRAICTHLFASNHIPRTSDSSEGFTRRWAVLDFRHPVTPEKRKIGLGEDIVLQEREEIVAWAVTAMGRLMEQGEYTLPRSHVMLMEEMADMNNIVRAFVNRCQDIEVGVEGAEIGESDLYQLFWGFNLEVTQQRACSIPEFRARMTEMCSAYRFQIRTGDRVKGVTYSGIRKRKGA